MRKLLVPELIVPATIVIGFFVPVAFRKDPTQLLNILIPLSIIFLCCVQAYRQIKKDQTLDERELLDLLKANRIAYIITYAVVSLITILFFDMRYFAPFFAVVLFYELLVKVLKYKYNNK